MDGPSYLILHGIENHRPPAHWQFWLAARLAEEGHQVLYPGLPDPDAPSCERWHAQLHGLLAQQQGAERVVICHSLACLLWLRAADALDHRLRPARLLLVAPPESSAVPEAGADFRIAELDGPAVRASVRGQIVVACSDNDPYNPTGADRLYAPLGARIDVIEGAGHITPDTGYGRWPAVVQWAHDPAARLARRIA